MRLGIGAGRPILARTGAAPGSAAGGAGGAAGPQPPRSDSQSPAGHIAPPQTRNRSIRSSRMPIARIRGIARYTPSAVVVLSAMRNGAFGGSGRGRRG